MQMKVNDYKPKEIVKFIREWTELTQDEFAKSIHKSKTTLQDYEYGRANISLSAFLKMCKTHDVEIIIRKK